MNKKGRSLKCCPDQIDQMDPRIVNGKSTVRGDSPWQVRGGIATWELLLRMHRRGAAAFAWREEGGELMALKGEAGNRPAL